MVQRRGCLCFSLESRPGVRVSSHIVREELQSNKPVQPQIFSLVDHTHTADTEFLHDAVVRDGLADQLKKDSALGRRS
jgi:hypothetical protein